MQRSPPRPRDACVGAILLGLLLACRDARPAPAGTAVWGAHTDGGLGGAALRVTTLAAAGEGSLRAALETPGPRIVVFDVGGVIDLAGRSLRVREPFLTVAGETAPSPGITLVRGGLRVETHDVVVRHLRIRPGEAGHAKGSGWEVDALTTAGRDAHDIVVEHCSLAWATDENLSATGPRFDGGSPAEWRASTSRRIAFRDNIVAEGLSRSTHAKGEHSKGTLIHDNVTQVTLSGNLYAHNVQRNPLFKGGSSGIVVNNVVYDPGEKALHYALRADEWEGRPFETGRLAVVGNVLKLGPASGSSMQFFLVEGDGPLELYAHDNLVLDRLGRAVEHPQLVRDPSGRCRRLDAWTRPPGVVPLPAAEVLARVLREAGARPWDRDEIDLRLVREVRAGTGRIVDDETQAGGY